MANSTQLPKESPLLSPVREPKSQQEMHFNWNYKTTPSKQFWDFVKKQPSKQSPKRRRLASSHVSRNTQLDMESENEQTDVSYFFDFLIVPRKAIDMHYVGTLNNLKMFRC